MNRSKTKDRTAVPLTNHIRHHPSIGITPLNTNRVPQYRIWLACRHLDQTGSGQLSIATIKQAFTPETAVFRLCGWRRLRQILHKGNGHFWTWNHQQNRLWLFGTVRIAKNLGTQRLEGQPVWLPTKAFTNGIGHFKAHLYAAWHSSRNQQSNKVGTPISRQTQQQLTQVPQRTQRHYEKQAGVKTKTNLAVGSAYTPTNIEKHTWKKGGAIFQFVDKNGRLGKKNGRYVAWQMPNSYIGPHAVAARGNQRRVNRQLIDLVQKGAQGNNEPLKTQRRYFQNGRFAAKAISQHQIKEGYWPLPDNHRYQLWSVFFE
ncbi:MAG: hypothetical protein GY943_15430 [Chloroflexi bacterium]|nr:hypothetical protein [Chloroflexota bacterium]